MMHVLIAEGLIDRRTNIDRYTLGFALLEQRVRNHPPEWAAQVCVLELEEVVQLARD
jgi:anaerobic selenocysteine-containing dehydrogenase